MKAHLGWGDLARKGRLGKSAGWGGKPRRNTSGKLGSWGPPGKARRGKLFGK